MLYSYPKLCRRARNTHRHSNTRMQTLTHAHWFATRPQDTLRNMWNIAVGSMRICTDISVIYLFIYVPFFCSFFTPEVLIEFRDARLPRFFQGA